MFKLAKHIAWLVWMYVLLSTLLISCESEPDIMNDDALPTLFVWGNVDLHSGKAQARIRQAIQEEGNAYDLAQDPNSILPKDLLEVKLIVNSLESTSVLDMLPVVYPKQEGYFATEQNIIYEVSYPIPEYSSCQIQIRNLRTGEIITSSRVSAIAPAFKYPYDFGWFEMQYNFTIPDEPFHVTFDTDINYVMKLITEIKYLDILNNGDTLFQKGIFEGSPLYGNPAQPEFNKDFPMEYILNIMASTIPDNPEIKYRKFYRFNFKVFTASSQLRNYLKYGQYHSDNRKLLFSNMTGGSGIFYACDYSQTGHIKPTISFFRALLESPVTENLEFSQYIFDGPFRDPDSTNSQSSNNSILYE